MIARRPKSLEPPAINSFRLASYEARVVTDPADGFVVVFESIVPGDSVGGGASYRRTDLWGGRLSLSVQARGSSNESYLGRFVVSLSHLLCDRAFLNFSTLHRDIFEMP